MDLLLMLNEGLVAFEDLSTHLFILLVVLLLLDDGFLPFVNFRVRSDLLDLLSVLLFGLAQRGQGFLDFFISALG